MANASFVAYVGDPDFHDGSVLSVERQDGGARVRVRGASGRIFVVDFRGVSSVRANSPEGMMLYALSELRAEPPTRRFVFVNWDDRGQAFLEIDAADFSVFTE